MIEFWPIFIDFSNWSRGTDQKYQNHIRLKSGKQCNLGKLHCCLPQKLKSTLFEFFNGVAPKEFAEWIKCFQKTLILGVEVGNRATTVVQHTFFIALFPILQHSLFKN